MPPARIPVHAPAHTRTRARRTHDAALKQRMYWGRWRRYSKKRLAERPWCVKCWDEDERAVRAVVTDHDIPHQGDERLFWDEKNHQSLCKRHHDEKTAREDGGFGNLVRVREHDCLPVGVQETVGVGRKWKATPRRARPSQKLLRRNF